MGNRKKHVHHVSVVPRGLIARSAEDHANPSRATLPALPETTLSPARLSCPLTGKKNTYNDVIVKWLDSAISK